MTTTPPTPYRDGSRKAAVSLLALLHQARHARSPTSTVSIRHPTAAHDSLGQPFEEVTKTHELPSLHQLTSLFDAVACNTNTHPDPSRVPPLVTAAMSLLSRAPAWSKSSQSRALAACSPQALGRRFCCLGPCRCAAWLDHGRAVRLQLAPPAALLHQPRVQVHGRRPTLLRAAPQDALQQRLSRPLALPEFIPCAPPQGAPGGSGLDTRSH